jgi:hypothetical protein
MRCCRRLRGFVRRVSVMRRVSLVSVLVALMLPVSVVRQIDVAVGVDGLVVPMLVAVLAVMALVLLAVLTLLVMVPRLVAPVVSMAAMMRLVLLR